MTQAERDELLALQRQIRGYVLLNDKQILDFPADGDDQDFNFLLSRAISFQRMLAKIEQDINEKRE